VAQTGVSTEKLAPWWFWVLIGLAIVAFLGLFGALVIWVPALLVDRGAATDDAYLQAITNTRTTLVQAVGGFAVFLGVVVGLFTLRHNRQLLRASGAEHVESLQANHDAMEQTLAFNRESLIKTVSLSERGQITDRYSKAIEQLGTTALDAVELRLGGIYALEHIARDDPEWHLPVVEVLAAFVRQHARGVAPEEGATVAARKAALYALPREKQRVRAGVDVATAIDALARRARKDDMPSVDFGGTDFCRVEFSTMVSFERSDFAHTDFRYAFLMFADFRKCHFLATKFEGCDLVHGDLRGSRVVLTEFAGVDLDKANLEGTVFDGSNLSGALNLTIDQLKVATINDTALPDYIDVAALDAARQVKQPSG
jgi:Pentapeptide repeats (9 copies)